MTKQYSVDRWAASPSPNRIINNCWPADKVPGARQGLTESEAAKLAQLQRRPFALNKRERDQLAKLLRKANT
jgi:hypothetical protein